METHQRQADTHAATLFRGRAVGACCLLGWKMMYHHSQPTASYALPTITSTTLQQLPPPPPILRTVSDSMRCCILSRKIRETTRRGKRPKNLLYLPHNIDSSRDSQRRGPRGWRFCTRSGRCFFDMEGENPWGRVYKPALQARADYISSFKRP